MIIIKLAKFYIHLYSPNKVAMYMKEQINNQKEVQAEKIQ